MAFHEPNVDFEKRKRDHLRLALSLKNQAIGKAGFDRVELIHEALPDLDFSEINISSRSLGFQSPTPFLISSMTAGHGDSTHLNALLARVAQDFGWRMGVGSQRRELNDKNAAKEWKAIRRQAPKARLFGNLGISQLIHSPVDSIERLVDSLEASGMIIHLNALQECLQPEGTPNFRGGLKAIRNLAKKLSVPVIVKETGCGFSRATLKRLSGLGLGAVDVSGFGGTHWGRIEGDRNSRSDARRQAAETLADWGIPTVESLAEAITLKRDYEVWASGGVRTGLDAAKLLAMGADVVGFAAPVLAAAVRGEKNLRQLMSSIEFEVKTVMFCTGCKDINELRKKKVWKWRGK